MNGVVKNTLSLYKNEMAAKTVTADLHPRPIPVYVDSEQIKRALMNLIKNGLEAIGKDGKVVVRTISTKDNATIIIADDGTGLSLQAKQNLFTPYFTTKPGGSGLGLVIVKKIILEHDGKIRLADSTEGGTAAVIDLPIHGKID